MSRHLLVAVVLCLSFAASANPAVGQVIPRVVPTAPIVPVVPIVPMPIPLSAPTSVRVPIHVHTPPLPQPPIPLDSSRGGPSLMPATTTPTVDLRGTLANPGGSTPTVRESQAEPADVDFTGLHRTTEPTTTYADAAAEARDAQTRGVALHPGGQPPPKDKDDDDDEQEEGNNWWLWVLLVIGALVVSSWMRKGR